MFALQAAPVLQEFNEDRYHAHCLKSTVTRHCGKFEMIDGHAKVVRSRCAGELDQPVAIGPQLVSGEHIYYGRLCPETPERLDPDGLCKVRANQGC